MKYAKTITKNKMLWFITVFVVLIPAMFYYAVYQTYAYIEQRDNKIWKDGWEVGYMQGQIDQEELIANECFNISKNPELNRLLKEYFKECRLAKTMWAIAQAESSGKQFAVGHNDNGSLDGGWLQVNTIHKRKGETNQQFIDRVHDLEENIKEAKKVYDKQGLTAWVQYNNKNYLKYMK